jgi:5'-3' exonuclease
MVRRWLFPYNPSRRLGVEFLVAPYEADAQMAWLAGVPEAQGGVAAVVTEDSDMLCYAAVRAVLFKVRERERERERWREAWRRW